MIADLAAQSQQEANYDLTRSRGERRITTSPFPPAKKVPPRFFVLLLDDEDGLGSFTLDTLTDMGRVYTEGKPMPERATDRSDGTAYEHLFLGAFAKREDAERAMAEYIKREPLQKFGVYDLFGTYKMQLSMEDGNRPGIRGAV